VEQLCWICQPERTGGQRGGAGGASPRQWPHPTKASSFLFPPYPYRAGHYPKADWYYQLPPYTAIEPSFYRRRYFMMAQERDRYRYMPHIFHGYSDGDRIDNVDIQGISNTLKGTYSD
jgi:hypothetical protein